MLARPPGVEVPGIVGDVDHQARAARGVEARPAREDRLVADRDGGRAPDGLEQRLPRPSRLKVAEIVEDHEPAIDDEARHPAAKRHELAEWDELTLGVAPVEAPIRRDHLGGICGTAFAIGGGDDPDELRRAELDRPARDLGHGLGARRPARDRGLGPDDERGRRGTRPGEKLVVAGEDLGDPALVPLMILIDLRLKDLDAGCRPAVVRARGEHVSAVPPDAGRERQRARQRRDGFIVPLKPRLGQRRVEEDDHEIEQVRAAPGAGLEKGEVRELRVLEEIHPDARREARQEGGHGGPAQRPQPGPHGARRGACQPVRESGDDGPARAKDGGQRHDRERGDDGRNLREAARRVDPVRGDGVIGEARGKAVQGRTARGGGRVHGEDKRNQAEPREGPKPERRQAERRERPAECGEA